MIFNTKDDDDDKTKRCYVMWVMWFSAVSENENNIDKWKWL